MQAVLNNIQLPIEANTGVQGSAYALMHTHTVKELKYYLLKYCLVWQSTASSVPKSNGSGTIEIGFKQ